MKSKLIESLKRLSGPSAISMGFGRRQESQRPPSMLILADFDSISEGQLTSVGVEADALLFSGSKISKEAIKKGIKSLVIPWGIRLKEGKDMAEMRELGLDFLVLPLEETEASILRTEEMGKVIEIDANLSDSQIRALEFMPVDALLLSHMDKRTTLTIKSLLACQRADLLVSKPMLGYVPARISSENLRSLWEAGLDGAIVKSEEITQDELKRIKEAIKSFPAYRGEKKHTEALIPSLPPSLSEE